MKGAVQTALVQNTPVFFTNLHETKIISLRNSDNYENEKKKLKQKINFHKTILIFLKGSNLRLFFLILSVSYIIINHKHDINFLFFKTGHARIQIVLSEGVQHFYVFFYLISYRSKYHYKQAIIGPPAKRHLNGVSLSDRWWPNTELTPSATPPLSGSEQ